MDSPVTLNASELDRLREFIYKRGFRDPVVINEILDHFACKVEEWLSSEPKLNLEEAMKRAHHDFGVKGFRPLVALFEQEVHKKYKRLYWSTVRENLFSLKFIPIMIMGGWLFFQYCLWSLSAGKLQGNIAMGLLTAYTLLELCTALYTHKWKNLRKNYFLRHGVKTSGALVPWLIWVVLVDVPKEKAVAGNYPYLAVIIATAVFIYLLLHSMARYHTQKAAVDEYELFRERTSGSGS
jgi:hypothetical protein